MKLSELSTDRAADVLCEISVFLLNITSDEDVITSLKLNTKEAKTVAEKYAMAANRVSQWVPMLLKNHREDTIGAGNCPQSKRKASSIFPLARRT